MLRKLNKVRIFNADHIKLIALIFMVIDHIGMIFFPVDDVPWRILGRISFPLFAFMIAEGCIYTRHKLKRWLLITAIGVIIDVTLKHVDHIFITPNYLNIMLVFSTSVLLIYCLDYIKRSIFFTFKPIQLVISILALIIIGGLI